jgi:hypothetical protein
MTTKILVPAHIERVDCEPTTCGKCHKFIIPRMFDPPWCTLFRERLDDSGKPLRLPECLAAERKD